VAVHLTYCATCRPDGPDPLLDAVLLHCLNHCAKAADRVKSGNERLKAGDGTGVEPPRDQGFARPKVCVHHRLEQGEACSRRKRRCDRCCCTFTGQQGIKQTVLCAECLSMGHDGHAETSRATFLHRVNLSCGSLEVQLQSFRVRPRHQC